MIRAKTERPARNRMMVVGLLAVLMTVGLMLTAKPAHAVTFTVDSSVDGGNGICSVGGCTLREAIVNANNTPGADTINFNIGGTGVKTIFPTSELPLITDPVTIDGYSQPGSSPNTLDKGTNAILKIQLDGSSAGSLSDGLTLGPGASSSSVVKGLVINRFGGSGIFIAGGTSGVRIEGNFVGTDPSGTIDLGNGFNGVSSFTATNNLVGGETPDKRNLISGNGGNGVFLFADATTTLVEGNLIGTKKDGTSALGNTGNGVLIKDASDNLVNGASPAAANTIAFNGSDGVVVSGSDSTGNRILLNSIFSNGGLGIDLVGGTEDAAGATANDPKDPDQGANGLQNKPVITSATSSGSTTTIKAKLNSTPNRTFEVLFFSNASGDEGEQFIGKKSVTTNSKGNVAFTFVPSQAVAAGQRITATATNVVEANTSEFSGPRTVVRG
jgi:CSLREA domain-containing protein